MAENINGAAALTPTNLLATSILSTPNKRFQNAGWNVRSHFCKPGATRFALAYITVPDTPAREIVKHAIEVSQLNEHETPSGEIVQAEQTEAVLLTYYQNNSLHVFALASLLARLVRFSKLTRLQPLITNCEVLRPYMEAELMWSWHSDFETAIRQTLDVMVELGVVVEEDELVKIPPPTSDAAANLTDLAEVVEPMLERFHIVTTLLKHNPTDSRESLESTASGIAQQLSTIYGLSAPEFFDKKLFNRFLDTLEKQGDG